MGRFADNTIIYLKDDTKVKLQVIKCHSVGLLKYYDLWDFKNQGKIIDYMGSVDECCITMREILGDL